MHTVFQFRGSRLGSIRNQGQRHLLILAFAAAATEAADVGARRELPQQWAQCGEVVGEDADAWLQQRPLREAHGRFDKLVDVWDDEVVDVAEAEDRADDATKVREKEKLWLVDMSLCY